MIRPAAFAIWLLALVPGLLALLPLAAESWTTAPAVLGNLGRLAGIAGLGFLLVSAILSSRVPGFDRHFGGLTKLWRSHHLIAAIGFLLLLAHPLLLAFAGGGDPARAMSVLLPEHGRIAMAAGWVSLILMMVFLAPSFHFFGEPHYQRWKSLHKLAGPTIVFALVHALMLDRTIPPPFDYVLWGGLSLLAVAALAWRWLFSRAMLPGSPGRLPFEVTRVEPVSSGVVELSLRPTLRSLDYEPGQFVYLSPYDRSLAAGHAEEHPYTISSSPDEQEMRVAIKDLGNASHAIQSVRVGTEARIEGPYSALFDHAGEDQGELWIAGGIGITPFLSRARHLRGHGAEVDVCLVFCVQDEARALFFDELTKISESLPGFAFHMHYFYKEGPLNGDFIAARCPDAGGRETRICGPTPLLVLARRLAVDAGVPHKRIHSEEFNLL